MPQSEASSAHPSPRATLRQCSTRRPLYIPQRFHGCSRPQTTRVVTLGIFDVGDVFGEHEVIQNLSMRSLTAVSLTPAVVFRLSKRAFMQGMDNFHEAPLTTAGLPLQFLEAQREQAIIKTAWRNARLGVILKYSDE